jgi:branched-chain amino acid transport system substrate-binding protein
LPRSCLADHRDRPRGRQTLRSRQFDTVLGTIGFDAKGDVTGDDTFAWYVWNDGAYAPVDPADLLQ